MKFTTLIVWVAAIVAIIMLLSIQRCGFSFQRNAPQQELVPMTPTQQLQKAVAGTNWLVTLSILGVGAGFFSFLNGGTRGIQIMGACFVVLSLVLGVARYSAWIAFVAVIGAAALLAYTIFAKTKAVKEIVKGVQKFKDSYDAIDEDPVGDLKRSLAEQSKSTQELVKEVKKAL